MGSSLIFKNSLILFLAYWCASQPRHTCSYIIK